MPKVYNRKTGHPHKAIYVGRPTKWGNPFVIGPDGSRKDVIEKYRTWVTQQGLPFSELSGKDLVCWCSPLACHADVLLELANAMTTGGSAPDVA